VLIERARQTAGAVVACLRQVDGGVLPCEGFKRTREARPKKTLFYI